MASTTTNGISERRRAILVATDFSTPSVAAIDWTARHLVADGDRIVILNVTQEVVDGASIGDADIYAMSDPAATEAALEAARKAMGEWEAHLRERTEAKKNIEIVTDISIGAAGETIVEKAVEHDVDMLVVGTHGRSGLQELILGSVSQFVSKNCKQCPVVLVNSKHNSVRNH